MDDKEKIEKINKYLKDNVYKEKILKEIKIEEKEFKFKITGKPENYVRERKGKGNRFYNKKKDKMNKYKNLFLQQLSLLDYTYTRNLVDPSNKLEYYIEIKALYYLPIPKNDSIKKIILKENKIIRPAIRPDLDNYDKFLLDSLHDVVFDDDKRVVTINSEKYYSLNPRTEVIVTLKEIK